MNVLALSGTLSFLALASLLTTCGQPGEATANEGSPPFLSTPPVSVTRRTPPVQAAWSYNIGGSDLLNSGSTPTGTVVSLDLYNVTPATITRLRAAGKYIVCYYSAGSSERYRSDTQSLRLLDPALNLGDVLKGDGGVWVGERWLDIRSFGTTTDGPGATIRSVMTARLSLAREKGCNAVEPDNVDAWNNDVSRRAPIGTPANAISAQDQLAYNRWTAETAHALGLSVLLKNDLEQIPALLASYDGALNEECFDFEGDCAQLVPFRDAGKAVYVVEYHAPDFMTAVRQEQAARWHLNVVLTDLNITRLDPLARFGTW